MCKFAGMEKTFTPHEAFRHFLENWEGAIPKDVQGAKYVLQGKPVRSKKKGRNGEQVIVERKVNLCAKRIKHLLDTYAPGKYELNEFFIFKG